MVSVISSALGDTVSFLSHVDNLIERLAADHRRSYCGQAARARSQSAFERLTGGASLALVFGAGEVREKVVTPSVVVFFSQVGYLAED